MFLNSKLQSLINKFMGPNDRNFISNEKRITKIGLPSPNLEKRNIKNNLSDELIN